MPGSTVGPASEHHEDRECGDDGEHRGDGDERADHRGGLGRDHTCEQQDHPDAEQNRGKDDPPPLLPCQEPGELGFMREVSFDLVELALFVLG